MSQATFENVSRMAVFGAWSRHLDIIITQADLQWFLHAGGQVRKGLLCAPFFPAQISPSSAHEPRMKDCHEMARWGPRPLLTPGQSCFRSVDFQIASPPQPRMKQKSAHENRCRRVAASQPWKPPQVSRRDDLRA